MTYLVVTTKNKKRLYEEYLCADHIRDIHGMEPVKVGSSKVHEFVQVDISAVGDKDCEACNSGKDHTVE